MDLALVKFVELKKHSCKDKWQIATLMCRFIQLTSGFLKTAVSSVMKEVLKKRYASRESCGQTEGVKYTYIFTNNGMVCAHILVDHIFKIPNVNLDVFLDSTVDFTDCYHL